MRASLHNATTEALLPHKYDKFSSRQSGPVSLFGTTVPMSAPNYGAEVGVIRTPARRTVTRGAAFPT